MKAYVLALLAAVSMGCGAKPPSPADVRRAVSLKYDVSQGGDPFTLRNACYEKLGDCRGSGDGQWSYALDGVEVREIGRRRGARRGVPLPLAGVLYHTATWWPTKEELSVTCRCGARSAAIRVPQAHDVTDYGASGGWRTTNAL